MSPTRDDMQPLEGMEERCPFSQEAFEKLQRAKVRRMKQLMEEMEEARTQGASVEELADDILLHGKLPSKGLYAPFTMPLEPFEGRIETKTVSVEHLQTRKPRSHRKRKKRT